jgi:hypothetical protein
MNSDTREMIWVVMMSPLVILALIAVCAITFNFFEWWCKELKGRWWTGALVLLATVLFFIVAASFNP